MPTASFNKLMNRLLGVKIEFQRKIFDYFTAVQVCFLPLTTMRDIQDGICKCCRLDSRTMYWQNGFLANDMELGAFLRLPLPVQTLKVLRHIWIPATPVHSSCCLKLHASFVLQEKHIRRAKRERLFEPPGIMHFSSKTDYVRNSVSDISDCDTL